MARILIEKRISAKDNEALNRSAVATADVEGGTLVKLGSYADGVFSATVADGTDGVGLWMAYNPSEHFTKVGDKIYAGLSADPRDYVNLANRTFDVFKPMVGDIVGIVGDISTATAGSYLIADDENGFAVEGTTHTAGNTALKVLAVEKLAFPRAGIGDEFANVYVAEVVEN